MLTLIVFYLQVQIFMIDVKFNAVNEKIIILGKIKSVNYCKIIPTTFKDATFTLSISSIELKFLIFNF